MPASRVQQHCARLPEISTNGSADLAATARYLGAPSTVGLTSILPREAQTLPNYRSAILLAFHSLAGAKSSCCVELELQQIVDWRYIQLLLLTGAGATSSCWLELELHQALRWSRCYIQLLVGAGATSSSSLEPVLHPVVELELELHPVVG
ncbi:hypothetical protein RRG08_048565 [Elysia crispata]|uniref:Uncharacterized protein n=1 Tax=Elysia crispata TaxID=231223 RepID=A0AAE1B6Z7_9GAST|nr:hypothetical protein RRG08_048565 [Elysia crispata]